MQERFKVNRNYKDRLFRFLFNDKEKLLSLYNAVNGTAYDTPEDLTINTKDNIIYMGMKNDLSFLIYGILNLYEHQSTWNPNMSLRNLFYITDLYKGYIELERKDIFGSQKILLPTPRAIVFYNGRREEPERTIIKLSESYEIKVEKGCLELETEVININYGSNRELMEKCRPLLDYAIFTDKIREYNRTMNIEKSVEKTIEECIKENILADILRKYRGEVTMMILEEYDEQAHIENEKRISRDEGRKEGQERKIIQLVCKKLKKNKSVEQIADELEEEIGCIKGICEIAQKYAPEYDYDKVYEEIIREASLS